MSCRRDKEPLLQMITMNELKGLLLRVIHRTNKLMCEAFEDGHYVSNSPQTHVSGASWNQDRLWTNAFLFRMTTQTELIIVLSRSVH